MSWGNKLVVVFIVFAGLIFTLVYKAVNTHFDLVSKDYYQEELRYQDRIDGMQHAAELSKTSVSQHNENVIITFPYELAGKAVQGEAWFYCKTDAGKDRKMNITTDDSGRCILSKKQILAGNYTLKLSWEIRDKKYYTELPIAINN